MKGEQEVLQIILLVLLVAQTKDIFYLRGF